MSTAEIIRVILFVTAFAAVYILEAILLIQFVRYRVRRTKTKNPLLKKPALALHLAAIIGIACVAYGYFVEPTWIEITRVNIATDKLDNTSFRIVHISDLHCETRPRAEDKVIRYINDLNPDIIVFTGDALSTPNGLPVFKDTMQRLTASIGKIAVNGNFDAHFSDDIDIYSDTGFQLLDHNTVTLEKDREQITIAGLSFDNPQAATALLESIPPGSFTIFLHHYSDLIEDLAGPNLDLYLCGHTHGGQIRLPLYGAIITLQKFGKKYESGLYKVEHTTLYVNRGIGLEAAGKVPEVRFLTRPEITVFDVTPKN